MNSIEQKWNPNKQYIGNRFYDLINFWVEKEKKCFFDRIETELQIDINIDDIQNPRKILSIINKKSYKDFIEIYYDYLKDGMYIVLGNIENPNERIELIKYAEKLIKGHMIGLYIHSGGLESSLFFGKDIVLENTKDSLIKTFSKI